MGNQHIIEVNGKRYDALTGKMVTEKYTNSKISSKSPLKTSGTSMDGVARRSPHTVRSQEHLKRPVQKSKTLMRATVQKPTTNKVHAVATVVHQKPVTPRNSAWSNKLKNVHKSPLISKFGSTKEAGLRAPQDANVGMLAQKVTTTPNHRAAPEIVASAVNPLRQAVANATSHKQPKLRKPKLHHRVAGKLNIHPRVFNAGALVLAMLLLAGFFGYQNVPNLRMRLAAQQAGVSGSLPAYQPPGFRLENISHKPGEINITYQSNSDDRKFAVTQAASAWNSETLRDKLKTSGDTASPVEIPDKGKTLFIYNDSNITWVDGGIWYRVEGDSKLSSDQLLRLANSL